jgi:catechol 2,3-dioxygenase-like lactoylglutathione lyase family enzyme
VRDLDRSVRFYTVLLGLVEKGRGSMAAGGRFVGLFDPVTKAELELNWYPPGSPYDTPYSAGEGLDHLGFEVEDARTTVRELAAAGAELAVEPWLERGRYWIAFVKDPDGNWIEIQSVVEGAPSAPSGSS